MRYLFFDIECSNCFDGIGKMCEFGYTLTDEEFNVIAKHEFPMSPGKGKNNRFHLRDRLKGSDYIVLAYDESYYYEQPEFPYFYEKIKKLLSNEDTLCFGWAISNDIQFLYGTCKRYGKEPISFDYVDVQRIADMYFKLKAQSGLKDVCERLLGKSELIGIQEHLSSDDAKMTMMVLRSIAKKEGLSSKELLKKLESAKRNSSQFAKRYEAKMEKMALIEKNNKVYRNALNEDHERGAVSQIGHRYRLSGDAKNKIEDMEAFIKAIHDKGGFFVKELGDADFLILGDIAKKDSIDEHIKGLFRGEYVSLSSVIDGETYENSRI